MQNVKTKKELHKVENVSYKFKKKIVYHFFKRILDIFLSAFALIVLSPFLLIISALVYFEDGGSVIYTQIRIGKNGRPFKLYKFRSMKVNADKEKRKLSKYNESQGATFKIENDPRITKIGYIMRRFSIDELPQLINIIKGDMSIVGPRPFIKEEQDRLSVKRLRVKPGLTCYWQINGGNKLTIKETEYYDEKYIHERSITTDTKIIFETILYVLKGKNI